MCTRFAMISFRYKEVGSALVLTMAMQAVVANVWPLLKAYVLTPLLRWRKRGRMQTQRQLDALSTGPEFSIATRLPFTLNTITVNTAE